VTDEQFAIATERLLSLWVALLHSPVEEFLAEVQALKTDPRAAALMERLALFERLAQALLLAKRAMPSAQEVMAADARLGVAH
jgi:hypothetical protein